MKCHYMSQRHQAVWLYCKHWCAHCQVCFLYTRHTRIKSVALALRMSLSLSLILTHSCIHTVLSSLSLASVLHFFSLHQLSDIQQWAVTLEKNRAWEGGKRGEAVFRKRAGGTLRKKRDRKCEGKRDLFKGGVRRVQAQKRLRGRKWWSEK